MIHYQLQRKLWHWKENKAFRILVFLYGKKTSNLNHTIKMSIKLNTEMYTTNVGGSTCCMGNSWHLQNNNIISRYSINILEQIFTSVVSLRCRRTQSNTFTTLWLSSKQLWNNFCQVKKVTHYIILQLQCDSKVQKWDTKCSVCLPFLFLQ